MACLSKFYRTNLISNWCLIKILFEVYNITVSVKDISKKAENNKKRLMFLITTEGKTLEETKKEVNKAYQNFKQVQKNSLKEIQKNKK